MRNGSWMQTYTGKKFWPLDPRPEEICIEDIAHALSLLCRYGGHCLRFYSVAEHSLHVSSLCSQENKLWALLHDAAEAYLVDIPRPIKQYLPKYEQIENKLIVAIGDKFGLPSFDIPEEVKRVDNGMLICERDQIMSTPPGDWNVEDIGLNVKIECYSPEVAESLFLMEFEFLT